MLRQMCSDRKDIETHKKPHPSPKKIQHRIIELQFSSKQKQAKAELS